MALISCPECGRQVSDRAVSCPDCGCPISAAPAPVPVQQNNAEELSRLLTLARRAREGSDSKNAKRYYDQILDKDPGNWEAIFYTVYFEASECKIMNISGAANSVANCIYSTFAAISDLPNEADREEAAITVIQSATGIAGLFASSAKNHYNQFSTTTGAFNECAGRVVAAGNIYFEIESGLKKALPALEEVLTSHQKSFVSFLTANSKWYASSVLVGTQRRLDAEIAEKDPVYGAQKEKERKIAELQAQINSLDGQINGLVLERKANAGCLGGFFLTCGIVMLVIGAMLFSLTEEIWPFLVAVPELLIAIPLLRPTPSQAVIDENMVKKEQLLAQRRELQEKLDAIK